MITHLDIIPPFLCVAVARQGKRRKTLSEIAQASGLHLRKVERLADRLSWSGVKVADVAALSAACGVDLICQGETREYLRRQSTSKSVLPHLSAKQLARFNLLMASFRGLSSRAHSAV